MKNLQNEILEILLNNHILYRLHRCFQQGRVGCVGVVDVDFPTSCSIDLPKPVCKILLGSFRIAVFAFVVGKVGRDGREPNLFVEEVDLVQEQDDWFILEPFSVDEGFEQHHSFVHLVLAPGLAS